VFELKKTVNFNLVTDVLGRIKGQMGISNITGLVSEGEILFFFAAAKEKQGGICQRNSKSTGKHTLFSTWWQLKYVFYPDYSGNDPF